MSFPNSDQYWIDTVNFIKTYIKPEDKLLAPSEFVEVIPDNYAAHVSKNIESENLQWVVIHKGLLEEIDYSFVEQTIQHFKPVFANEVFVIFSKDQLLPAITMKSVHMKALIEKMNSLKAILKNSVKSNSNIAKNKIYFDIKEIGLSSRIEIELASRTMTQTSYLGDSTTLCRVLTKYMCYVDAKDISLTPHLCLNGYWETWLTQAIVRLLQPGYYCLDIGANCGYYSLVMSDIVGSSGKVLAVEANPRLAQLLDKSLNINGYKNYAKTLQKAAADTNGKKVKLIIPKEGLLGDSSIFKLDFSPEDTLIEVETVTIDKLTEDWPRVDFIKIDAEGAEYAIWQGMQNTIKQNKNIAIIMEFCCDRNYSPKDFLLEIQAQGFPLRYVNEDSQIKSLTIEECLIGKEDYWDLFLQRP